MNLTEIIKNEKIKGIVRNAAQGAYAGVFTPHLASSGLNEFLDGFQRKDVTAAEILTKGLTQCASALTIFYACMSGATNSRVGLVYLGSLVVTNGYDYLHRSSKHSDRYTDEQSG
jgi:hypothetical protein